MQWPIPLAARWTAFIIAGLHTLPAKAQDRFELFSLSGDWSPSSRLQADDGTDLNADLSVVNFEAAVDVPLRLSERALLVPGAHYGLRSIGQTGALVAAPDTGTFHDVSTSLLFDYRFTSQWRLTTRVALGLAGDFAPVSTEHLRYEGLALVSYAPSDCFSIGAGLLVGWHLGELRPLPAVRVLWKIADDLELSALLPTHATLDWRLHDRLELGVSASLRGQSYALAPRGDLGRLGLAVSRAEVGPQVAVRLASSFWLSLHAGYAFYRRYELVGDLDAPPPYATGAEPHVWVQARLVLRVPQSDFSTPLSGD